MMWTGSREVTTRRHSNNTANQALDYLLQDNGFLKIDDLLKQTISIADPGMLAVYDLILATKATHFATCARDRVHGCSVGNTTNFRSFETEDASLHLLRSRQGFFESFRDLDGTHIMARLRGARGDERSIIHPPSSHAASSSAKRSTHTRTASMSLLSFHSRCRSSLILTASVVIALSF